MRAYFQSGWVKTGLVLLFVGAGPLLFIIIAAASEAPPILVSIGVPPDRARFLRRAILPA